ncbi:MAG: DUF3822 family protein [Alistipes sp.]|nr:DUF3822 family protein [Alistipes sp.]
MSIRLASGGRFFSASTLGSTAEGSGNVVVMVDTARATLLPQALAATVTAEQALAITGQNPSAEEVAIYSAPHNQMVAAIAINRNAYQSLAEQLGARLVLTTPLLADSHSDEKCLAVELAENICYLRLYNDGLQTAEALEIESTDELLFYVAHILAATSTDAGIPIYIIAPKQYAKALKKYYKVVCE